jgi:pseudouridine-5'-monophosphatase
VHLLSFFPGIELDVETYLRERDVLQDAAWPHVPLMPGIAKLVNHLAKHKIPIAIATGARRRGVELKTSGHPEVFDLFQNKWACADDGVVKRGKPNPDIYLYAARALLGRSVGDAEKASAELTEEEGVERAKGLVFEDAIPGMQAGKRAGMGVVWVPDENLKQLKYDGIEKADQTLGSLEEFVPEQWGLPPYES